MKKNISKVQNDPEKNEKTQKMKMKRSPSHEICAAKHRRGRQIEYSRLGRPSSRDKRQAHRAPRKTKGLFALSHGR